VSLRRRARKPGAARRARADLSRPGRRDGGTARSNFAKSIAEVYAIRPAKIELEHTPRRWFMRASDYVTVRATTPVRSELGAVSCGIPGHDHPGEEVVADLMKVDDGALQWEVSGRCGFASDFDYSSDVA
jgi:hypothetical protein